MKQIRPEGAYINDIFARMDLQQIREFILNGTETYGIEEKSYDERLKEGSNPIYNRIENLYAENKSKMDEAASDISLALSTHSEVYMEIGMKAGARLLYQLLLEDTGTKNSDNS